MTDGGENACACHAGCACGGADEGASPKGWLGWGSVAAGTCLLVLAVCVPTGPAARISLYLLAYGVAGWKPLAAAVRHLAHGRIFDENFLMTVATLGALAIGEYPEAVAVMLFYQAGEALQEVAVNRSKRSIRALVGLRADKARVVREGRMEEVAPEAVVVGEILLIRPGERVALDGEVTEGVSALDLSALTGESLPRDVVMGSEVLAGAVNLTGVLRVRVLRPSAQSMVARILTLVREAAERKAKAEALVTRFARIYTPGVIALSIGVMMGGTLITKEAFSLWVYRGLIVLVASCPCALLISIPLGFFGGIGGASRLGVLVKGGNYLEALARVHTVVFDKTGTLTTGTFAVTDVRPSDGYSASEVLELAAHAEMHVSHPLAKSVVAAYGVPRLERVSDVCEQAGLGVSARVDGVRVLVGSETLLRGAGVEVPSQGESEVKRLWVAADGRYAGAITVADTVRPEAVRALADLRALGVRRLMMLTGDAEGPARAVAAAVGVDVFHANLLPDAKVERMREARRQVPSGGVLAYVGDGMNDAPVLAEADVGIAMGALGSDSAIEAADVVMMADDLTRLGAAVRQARATRTVIMQNVVFALGVKAAVLGASVTGFATMWEAVFADVGVALLATLNVLRLIHVRSNK